MQCINSVINNSNIINPCIINGVIKKEEVYASEFSFLKNSLNTKPFSSYITPLQNFFLSSKRLSYCWGLYSFFLDRLKSEQKGVTATFQILAEHINKSTRTIIRNIKKLCEDGFLKAKRTRKSRNMNAPNEYFVTIPQHIKDLINATPDRKKTPSLTYIILEDENPPDLEALDIFLCDTHVTDSSCKELRKIRKEDLETTYIDSTEIEQPSFTNSVQKIFNEDCSHNDNFSELDQPYSFSLNLSSKEEDYEEISYQVTQPHIFEKIIEPRALKSVFTEEEIIKSKEDKMYEKYPEEVDKYFAKTPQLSDNVAAQNIAIKARDKLIKERINYALKNTVKCTAELPVGGRRMSANEFDRLVEGCIEAEYLWHQATEQELPYEEIEAAYQKWNHLQEMVHTQEILERNYGDEANNSNDDIYQIKKEISDAFKAYGLDGMNGIFLIKNLYAMDLTEEALINLSSEVIFGIISGQLKSRDKPREVSECIKVGLALIRSGKWTTPRGFPNGRIVRYAH